MGSDDDERVLPADNDDISDQEREFDRDEFAED